METFKGNARCGFCGKTRGERDVKHLVAGPGIYICDQCVGLCVQLIADEGEQAAGDSATHVGPPETPG